MSFVKMEEETKKKFDKQTQDRLGIRIDEFPQGEWLKKKFGNKNSNNE